MLIKTNLKILQISKEARFLIERLSASKIENPICYLFFLNHNGRYFADTFLIEHEGEELLIAPQEILERLRQLFMKFDIRKTIQYFSKELFVYYSDTDGYQDPRSEKKIFISEVERPALNFSEYEKFRIENEIAEFDDFEEGKSIVLEYGKVANFISTQKGCYPGQELMNRTRTQGIVRKTVSNIEDENCIRKLVEIEGRKLFLKKC